MLFSKASALKGVGRRELFLDIDVGKLKMEIPLGGDMDSASSGGEGPHLGEDQASPQ